MRSFILIGLIGVLWPRPRSPRLTTRTGRGPRRRPRRWSLATGRSGSPSASGHRLNAELSGAVRLYGALVFAAQQVGDGSAMATFQGVLTRYVRARDQVRNGLDIDAASCKGSGAALQGKRFKHFRCSATSVVLEIPQTQLDYGDQDADGDRGSPRVIGPLGASLVHIAGKAAIAYQQLAR